MLKPMCNINQLLVNFGSRSEKTIYDYPVVDEPSSSGSPDKLEMVSRQHSKSFDTFES